MAPEQFWRLTPLEFWWIADARRPKKMYGNMTEDEVAELYEEMEQTEGWNA